MKTDLVPAAVVPNAIACQFTGKSHLSSGKPCQDAYALGKTRDERMIIALADGVSSSPNSEVAAKAAVQAAVEFWQEFDTGFPGEDAWQTALRASMNYALRKAEEAGAACQEAYGYETTLIIALICPGRDMVYSFVGDSGIYLLSDDGKIRLAEERMREDDGSVCTLSAGPDNWKYGKQGLEDCEAVLFVTDGVSDAVREADNDYALAGNFMAGVVTDHEYEQLCREELEKEAFSEMDDDATFILCRLKEGSGVEPASAGKTDPVEPADPARPWNEPEGYQKKKGNIGLISKLIRSFFKNS